ncbi:IS66 family transposase [Wenzhouxiangella limi]|uniref:IS66 family transposase n=1 Tax=Wenzhouxiangella limi TaxID=2707351 RepID=A0A845UX47_9GAMM|nr:IS66 family transposase [Wenzhouxiangella limi]NDY96433.1 IS66 family transposase [Wenzhouxiangella limi]
MLSAARNTLSDSPSEADRIAALQARISEQETQLQARAERIRQLEEIIRTFQRKTFAGTSEQASAAQLGLFNEAEEIEATAPPEVPVTPHARQRRGRPALPPELPREEIVYDLPDADKVCPHDGTALELIGQDTSEQLDIIPAQVKVIRHVRMKYACPCCQQHVAIAAKPAQPLGKSMAAPGLLAYIATAKYADALPLYRQAEQLKRLGIELDRTTLAHWMIQSGQLVQPLINRLSELILEQPVIGMDETTVQVLKEPDKTPQSTSYMWVMGAGPPGQRLRVFHYEPTRSGRVPMERLDGFAGVMMVDGYSGYGAACQAHGITRLGCWTHARRKFFEAAKLQPKGKTGRPDQALALIGKLYRVEQEARDMEPDACRALRQQQSRPILDQFQAWLTKTAPQVPPKTKLGQALHYLQAQWPALVRYLDDGRYPIDNNAIENAIRPFAIGRNYAQCPVMRSTGSRLPHSSMNRRFHLT